MARAKRYSAEQIVAKLREHEKLQAQGLTIPQACKRIGISDQTFYRWRIKYGALKEDEAQRLKALEQENARVKRIVADQALDISMLKGLSARSPVGRSLGRHLCQREGHRPVRGVGALESYRNLAAGLRAAGLQSGAHGRITQLH